MPAIESLNVACNSVSPVANLAHGIVLKHFTVCFDAAMSRAESGAMSSSYSEDEDEQQQQQPQSLADDEELQKFRADNQAAAEASSSFLQQMQALNEMLDTHVGI